MKKLIFRMLTACAAALIIIGILAPSASAQTAPATGGADEVAYQHTYEYDAETELLNVYENQAVTPVDICNGWSADNCSWTWQTTFAMYMTVANRPPTLSEGTYWSNLLASGVSTDYMAGAMINGFGLNTLSNWDFVRKLFDNITEPICFHGDREGGCSHGMLVENIISSYFKDLNAGTTLREWAVSDLATFFGFLGVFRWDFFAYHEAFLNGFDMGDRVLVQALPPSSYK